MVVIVFVFFRESTTGGGAEGEGNRDSQGGSTWNPMWGSIPQTQGHNSS